MRRDYERELNKKFNESEKKYKEVKHRKEIDQKQKAKDKELSRMMDQSSLSVPRKIENEEVKKRLEDFEKFMVKREQNKLNKLEAIKGNAKKHIDRVMEKLEEIKQRDPEEEKDYNELAKKFKRKLDAQKHRQYNLKNMKYK